MTVLAFTLATLILQQSDSGQVLRRARGAQAAFENTRRYNLPVELTQPQRCDEYVGRFCIWDDGNRNAPRDPPPEPERIRRARDSFLSRLDSAATVLPADDWIIGQRVRYLAEAARKDDALAAARSCQATPWWCAALTGLALHIAGDYAEADSAFSVAFGAMPSEERCRWMDLSALLEGDARNRYRALDCDARAEFAQRLWWLAQPLASRPGNDRKTEHYARAAYAYIERDARSPHHLNWAEDLRELEMRFGWSTYWKQHPARPGSFAEPSVIGYTPEPAFHFFPDQRDSGIAWQLDAPHPRESYAPPYARAFVPLDHQIALFRHGDSCVVVASYDVGRDTGFAGRAFDAALVLAHDERSTPVIEQTSQAPIVAVTTCESQLFSLELVAPAAHRVARARAFVQPPAVPNPGITLSDVLLFDPSPGDSLPADLAAVIPSVCGSPVTAAHRIGLFWETYGLAAAGEDVRIAVTVTPARTGWLRRTAQVFGIARQRAAIRLEWQERGRVLADGAAPRALAVDLTGLSRGSYQVEIAVTSETGRAARTAEIAITREPRSAR